MGSIAATIDAIPCDVVVAGTPVDLESLVSVRHPFRRVTYELREVGDLTLEDVLAPLNRALGESGRCVTPTYRSVG